MGKDRGSGGLAFEARKVLPRRVAVNKRRTAPPMPSKSRRILRQVAMARTVAMLKQHHTSRLHKYSCTLYGRTRTPSGFFLLRLSTIISHVTQICSAVLLRRWRIVPAYRNSNEIRIPLQTPRSFFLDPFRLAARCVAIRSRKWSSVPIFQCPMSRRRSTGICVSIHY
jgi:hypothetical protein